MLIKNLIDKLAYEPGTGHFINISYDLAVVFARYADGVTNRIETLTDNIATLYERLGGFYTTDGESNA